MSALRLGSCRWAAWTTARHLAAPDEGAKYLPPASAQVLVEHLEALVGAPRARPDADPGDGREPGPQRRRDRRPHGHPPDPHQPGLQQRARRDRRQQGIPRSGCSASRCRLFAYPNGKVGHRFRRQPHRILREAGFAAAFTTALGAITRGRTASSCRAAGRGTAPPSCSGCACCAGSFADRSEHLASQESMTGSGPQALAVTGNIYEQTCITDRLSLPAPGGQQRHPAYPQLFKTPRPPWLGADGPVGPSACLRVSRIRRSWPASRRTGRARAFALDVKRHIGIKAPLSRLLALPDRWTSWLVRRRAGRPVADPQAPPASDLDHLPDRDRQPDRLVLHRLTGLPWIADFRDPMLQSTYPTAPCSARLMAGSRPRP
jgi:hypothetical protein